MTSPLEALIAAAKQQVAAAEQAKVADKRAKTARTEEARLASLAESNKLREAIDWRPRAIVLLIEQWTCDCSAEGETPQGVYIFLEHIRLANSTRLVTPRDDLQLPDELPRRIKYLPRARHLCPDCMNEHGFKRIMTGNSDVFEQKTIPAQNGHYIKQWLDKRRPTQEQ